MNGSARKLLQIFIEDTDTCEGRPLYEAIVHLLYKRGVAGATVWSGLMGYGAHHRLHRKGLFGITDEKPLVVTAIDTEDVIRAILPELLPMVKQGLVVLQDAEAFVLADERKSEEK